MAIYPTAQHAAQFERQMGFSAADFLRCLPEAVGDVPWQRDGDAVRLNIDGETAHIAWQTLPPSGSHLLRLPRIQVRFDFGNVPDAARQAFMRRFDLYMHRGGG